MQVGQAGEHRSDRIASELMVLLHVTVGRINVSDVWNRFNPIYMFSS